MFLCFSVFSETSRAAASAQWADEMSNREVKDVSGRLRECERATRTRRRRRECREVKFVSLSDKQEKKKHRRDVKLFKNHKSSSSLPLLILFYAALTQKWWQKPNTQNTHTRRRMRRFCSEDYSAFFGSWAANKTKLSRVGVKVCSHSINLFSESSRKTLISSLS